MVRAAHWLSSEPESGWRPGEQGLLPRHAAAAPQPPYAAVQPALHFTCPC